jgi:hypothetical protein
VVLSAYIFSYNSVFLEASLSWASFFSLVRRVFKRVFSYKRLILLAGFRGL